MTVQRKDVYVCDYDGQHTATVYDSRELPAGWTTTQYPNDDMIPRYWCSPGHTASGGRASGVMGGVYSGGRTTTWVFTDDWDGTTATTTTDNPPMGWLAVRRTDGTFLHFKNQANTDAWFAANGATL